MILNNKSTNALGYTISLETAEQKKKIADDRAAGKFDPLYKPKLLQVAIFCGVTGNHPRELLLCPAFKADAEIERQNEGIEIIDENSKFDPVRVAMSVSDQAKMADFDVVEFVLKADQKLDGAAAIKLLKKQLHVIENLFKVKTLDEIYKMEKRSDVLLAIDRQYKSIEASVSKNTR